MLQLALNFELTHFAITLAWLALLAVHLLFIVRAILRAQRDPAARLAWVLAMVLLPLIGVIVYIFLGETNTGRGRQRRAHRRRASLPRPAATAGFVSLSDMYAPLFRLGGAINGFLPLEGNRARVGGDGDATIAEMIADIDAATETVHLCFYIWLPDHSGLAMVAALERAAARGVACRAMADSLGSYQLIRSPHWAQMRAAGVQLATTLKVGNPLLRALRGRIDLRNHRKIVVVDQQITWCGSQNCSDAAFRVKPRYAPWVDLMVRFEGPIATQNQQLFAADWMAEGGDDLTELLARPLPPAPPGFTAIVIGTGPTLSYPAMSEVFAALIHAARDQLAITTPYFVPDDAIQTALCASARRGVETSIIFPARNDSRVVAAASRSYYAQLLEAGVRIFEYQAGLLHAKTLLVDGALGMVGSANIDRRSVELNFENNILFHDAELVAAINARLQTYFANSREISSDEVAHWPLHRRLWHNSMAMVGPVL